MLYNPKIIINNLDFKFKTFMLSNSCLTDIASTNLIMPKIVKDVVQNSTELKSKIVTYQNNSSS